MSASRLKLASLLIASTGAAPLLLTAPALAQTVYHEVEPNDTKAQATVIDGGGAGMFPGDMIIGETRCTFPCGLYGPDVFLIKTAPAPLGFYRHRLVVTSDSPFNFTSNMPGVSIADCQADGDAYLDSRQPQPVLAEWYGIGKQERIYWKIFGDGTPLPYTATLQRDQIPRLATIGPLRPGPIQINAPAGIVFAYDANFNFLPGYSGYRGFFREFDTGTYQLAICTAFQAFNSSPCPPGETISNAATDFPDCIVLHWAGIGTTPLHFHDTQDRTVIVQPQPSAFSLQWLTMHVYYDYSCGSPDFDGDGDPATSHDIEAFFACLAGDCCLTCDPHGADFNGDGDVATDADIEAFFRVLAGGSC